MKVITLLNEKGGVGKTTLSTHLAAGLAIKGYKVILVDADPQGNATYVVKQSKRPDFYDLCARSAPWKNVLRPVHPDVYSEPNSDPAGELYICAGNEETRSVYNYMKNHTVYNQFQKMQGVIDYIVVDTSPTPSKLHEAIALASDYIIMPTDCEALSIRQGVSESYMHIGEAQEAWAERGQRMAQVIGVVPNRYRNTVLHDHYIQVLYDNYDVVWDAIPLSVVVAESQAQRQFLYGLYPDHPVTGMFWDIVERVERLHEQV